MRTYIFNKNGLDIGKSTYESKSQNIYAPMARMSSNAEKPRRYY